MKIPTVDYAAPKVRPVSRDAENFNFNDGTDSLVKGVGDLTQGVENVQAVNAYRAQKAKEKADGAAVDSLTAQAQAYTTDKLHGSNKPAPPGPLAALAGDGDGSGGPGQGGGSPSASSAAPALEHVPGWLDTKGNEAHATSGQLTEDLQKKYDDLLSTAGNDTQRAMLTKRLLGLKQVVRETVAKHESTQLEVAEKAASAGLQDSTVRMSSAMYNSPDELKPFVLESLASIKRTVLPEEYETKANEFLGKVAAARIDTFIANNDFDGAAHQVQLDSNALGSTATKNYSAHIKSLKDAAEKKASELTGEAIASREADKLRNPDGFLDEGKEAELMKAALALPPEQRGVVRNVIQDNIRFEVDLRKTKIAEWTNTAETMVNDGAKRGVYGLRTIEPAVRAKLEKYNQPFIARVIRDEQTMVDRWQRKKLNRSEELKVEREQKKNNELELTKMRSLSWEDQAEFEKKQGLVGRGLDELGVAKLQEQQRKAINWVKAGFGKAKESLDNELDQDTRYKEFNPDKGGSIEKRYDVKSDAAQGLEDFIETNKRAPDATERRKIIGEAIIKAATKPRTFLGYELTPGLERPYEKKARDQRQAALDWAKANPDDPDAPAVLKKLGVK